MAYTVACKTTGCDGSWKVSLTKCGHGQRFHCPRCKRILRYCQDCGKLLSNFRRHYERGHLLYSFQRKDRIEVEEACLILLSMTSTPE